MAIENNVSIKNDKTVSQVKPQNNQVQYKTNPNAVDKTPDKDTVSLSNGKAKNVGIGVAIGAVIAGTVGLLKHKVNKREFAEMEKLLKGRLARANEETKEYKELWDDALTAFREELKAGNAVRNELCAKQQENLKIKTEFEKQIQALKETSETTNARLSESNKKNDEFSKELKDYIIKEHHELMKSDSPDDERMSQLNKVFEKLTGNEKVVHEKPISITLGDGTKKQCKFQKTYNDKLGRKGLNTCIHYSIGNDEVAHWTGEIQRNIDTGEAVLQGGFITSHVKRNGLARMMKEHIKQDAIAAGCSRIELESAFGSQLFHNKMGYKVDFKKSARTFAKDCLENIKKSNKMPEFDEKINSLLADPNTTHTSINTLLDEIFTAANSKKIKSRTDLGLGEELVPFVYDLK